MPQIFNEIHLRNVRGDVFGGITAAVIALPMALAFGFASGAGPEAGLYGAILIGLFAAVFGGTPTLISEPTGPMTVVFTAVIATLIASDPVNGMAMAFTVVVMAGMFQILFGVMKLGKYVTMMPYSVVSGFMSGIGVILIVLQLGPLMGHPAPAGGVLGTLQSIPELVSNIQFSELILGVMTIAILFFIPKKIKKYSPPQLVALIAVTIISLYFISDADSIRRIDHIPLGLPDFRMPMFSPEQWQEMLVNAILLGLLGSIDALLTSVVADSFTRGQHNSDKELVGQGLGNIVSGLFGGMPGAGATMGTVVNIQSGGRTALSGIVRAALLLNVILWAGLYLEDIPLAVLSGIAFKVGMDIIDWKFLTRATKISKSGSMITFSVIALTVFVDLMVAVGIGLFVANIFTVMRLSKLQEDDVQAVTDGKTDLELTDRERELLNASEDHLLLMKLTGTMIFGTSRTISRKNSEVDCRALIVDVSAVNHLGVSAALAVEEAITDMLDAKRPVYLVGAQGQIKQRFENMGLLKRMKPERIMDDREKALELAAEGANLKV